MKTGRMVTIEGIEGAGKTTLAAALADRLRASGHDVVLTAEPGGGPIESRIRELLLDASNSINDRAELLLFEAARAQHVETLIRPALERGAIVICDRFADSSLAYQGAARGICIEAVARLNSFATGGLTPDVTILLDLSVEAGLARQKRPDRFARESGEFHERVRNAFLGIAGSEPKRFVVIDAAQELDAVLGQALDAVASALGRV